MKITGKVRHVRPVELENFKFVRSATKETPKVTIPSPTMLHFRGGRNAVDKAAYPDMDEFSADVA